MTSTASPLCPPERKVKTTFVATSLASSIEAFYRSGMNTMINRRLSGQAGSLFPVMHVQIPTRIVYINGLKQIRAALKEVDVSHYSHPNLASLLLSFIPGTVMCPLSSILEASNVKNEVPLAWRWLLGFNPRLVREIIFALGMNQLSDFCTECAPSSISNMHLRCAVGSITAGLISGYFSHIPHNLSTMMLQNPKASICEVWRMLYAKSLPLVPSWVPESQKQLAAKFLAVVFPRAVIRRSLQIGGTFIIINGILYSLRNKKWP